MTQMQEVAKRLRDLILGLELGPGEKLTERWAEAHFGASRTPIRAALLRLESEGLVVREGRGWMVAPIDLPEIEQLFVYREVLEVAAVRLTMAMPDLHGVDDVEALLDACGPDAARDQKLRVGLEFHIRLAKLSGNRFIIAGVADTMQRLSRARWLDNDPHHDGWAEHREILAAIRQGREDLAVARVGAHVAKSREVILAILQQDRRTLRARGLKLA